MLYTRSILSKKEPTDGVRISVMARHTLSDGVTTDVRIIEGTSFDEWNKKLAPPVKLVGAYYRKEITWEEYESAYLEYLRTEAPKEVLAMAKRCAKETITILCIESVANHCHRRLLAEEIQRILPEIQVVHR